MRVYLTLLVLTLISACQVKTTDSSNVVSNSTSSYVTSLTASTNILANGTATSAIQVTIKKSGIAAPGETPTLLATGSNNTISTCSVSDTNGISNCTLKSTKAEIKSISVKTPAISTAVTTTFIAGPASSTNTTLTSSGPTVADGVANATITVTLKDAFGNTVSGITPTFSATDTGSTNIYSPCSSSNTSGVSTCTLKSSKAEIKNLSLVTPFAMAGGTSMFMGGAPIAANSTIAGTDPVLADGIASSIITITLFDTFNNPSIGYIPTFSATDTGSKNIYGACSASNISGVSTCSLKSQMAESKVLGITSPVIKAGGTVVFTPVGPSALNSTITGTGPVTADGASTSTITITLKDSTNNPVIGQTPTFSATDNGSVNNYGTCSASNASGISTCTLSSTKAETKTLSIASPIVKPDGTVLFSAGLPSSATSTILGSTPVSADGVSTSSIVININDAFGNPVGSVLPTFTATDTGSNNIYGACSASSAFGQSTCTLASLTAEIKTLQLISPVMVTGNNITFISTGAVASTSTIVGTSPVIANGVATSTITITLKDINNNPVAGELPTFTATDSGLNNSYSGCSISNSSGISTCTLTSLTAETKTLSITSPFIKPDAQVVFTAGSAVAGNSTITGTGPVLADGIAFSTITITLKDANNNFVSGETPTFAATNTGSTNTYNTCSVSDSFGVSTCALSSSTAEVKTLSIISPVAKSDGTVTFTAGSASVANSTITGSGPVIANGTSTSNVTITLRDSRNNAVSGETPTFAATNTSSTNIYNACSVSDSSGVSTCSFSSSIAEVKTLSIATPVAKSDGTVTFTADLASVANSTITGTGPVIANGTSTSTITITLKDASNNAVMGVTPLFSATNTGSGNVYTACSSTDSSGVSTCTLKSTKSELKTLSITSPITKADGTVLFNPDSASIANSTITGSGPVLADGVALSTVTITLKDSNNNFVSGETPTFSATNTGSTNTYSACSISNSLGVSTCSLSSSKAEIKTLSIVTPVAKSDGTVTFTAGLASVANSTITGTGPVIANGTSTSTVTITLKDANNNAVIGEAPLFNATDTGSGNIYSVCSATDVSGISTCTLKSTKSELKTLSISSPITKADGTVLFNPGSAIAANSTITGTGPVIADGVAISTVTITLKDLNNNLVSGTTPTFTATNTGSTNTYSVCSVSDVSGISTCTLKSTKAQTKTLSIATPFVKAGGTVIFNAGSPSVANSDITGTSPVSADGISSSFISISIADAFGNPISGITPIFNATDTNSTNAYGSCSATDVTGLSMCTLSSTKAEVKTLQMTSPIGVTGSSAVTFSSSLPTSTNSSISGTGPVLADGVTDSTVTITLKDSNNNAVAGITPTFDATDTGAGNIYDACSMSNASGISICTFSSTKSEIKALRITNPVTKTGGSVTFTAGAAVAANSSIAGTGPVVADGTSTSNITITLKDINNNFVVGTVPTFSATNTGSGNTQTVCSATDSSGISTCTLKSTKAESKIPQILTPVNKLGTAISFIAGVASATTSTITGTGPTNPDGASVSTITVTLKDANSNAVAGIIPTFLATGTNNTYGVCSSTNSSGVSTCSMSSTTAELKTLSINSPVTKADGTVLFQSGSAVAANSTISGTGPVVADGTSTSTITITLKDSGNVAVIGAIPVFSAGGSANVISACSATDASGISTCTLKSTKAESKLLQITSPVIKSGNSVIFSPGAPSSLTSTIVASNPTLANGSDQCGITITLKDVNNNSISGLTPTYSMTGSNNTISSCTSSDSAGESFCTATSTKAQEKVFALLTPVAVAGNAVDFNPEGINIQVPIEMTDRGLASSTAIVTFSRSRTSLDPDDYVAQNNNFIFEVIADNINTTATYTIYLVDSAGVQISDSAISIPPNTTQKRFSISWTPNSTASNYRVRLPATAVASQVKVHSAKMIVEQTNAVATKIYIPLVGGDFSGEHNNDTTTAVVSSTTSATFVQPVASNFYQWVRNDTAYDAIASGTPWMLETVSSISNIAGTATVALFDKVNNLQITEATTNVTGSTAVSFRQASFASNATNFDNGDTMELRLKSTSAYTARLLKAGLWLKLKYLKKSEIYFRLSNRRSASTSAALPDARFLWEQNAWSNPTVFFQTNASLTTSSVSLQDHGLNDVGTTSPVTVTGSTITPTASYVIQRTGALSLTDSNRYFIQHNRTAGTAVLGGAFLVIQATE